MPSGCVRAKIAVNRYFFQCKNLFFETNLGTYRRSTLEILTIMPWIYNKLDYR